MKREAERIMNINCTWIYYTTEKETMTLPGEDLGHTAMGHPQLPGYVTRPNAIVCQLYYSLPYNVRQRPAVDKDATQLIHTAMA
jgi:hypothetical protein